MRAALPGRPPEHARQGSRIAGALAGCGCGFAVYWLGALLVAAGDLARQPAADVLQLALRPVLVVTVWEAVAVVAGGAVGLLVARSRWRVCGLTGYVGLVLLAIGFLAYSATVSIPAVPAGQRWLSYILFAAEAGGLLLLVVFGFYSLDAATRRRWERLAEAAPFDAHLRPTVAFVVPVFNEPVPMVRQTLLHLLRQDYPKARVRVVLADDSTDPATRVALGRLCAQLQVTYSRRDGRQGYKAGALNHAIARLPPATELIAVIDADYWVDPDYLRELVGHFADPRLSFVQTPQDYRNRDESFLTRQYARAEAYFYHTLMPSRNEQGAIIFCGTMGILRRSALQAVGGFAEDHICEDAEVSVRLAATGWRSLYVDRSFGKGLMPAVFDAYKKQFHRWSFGNVRILRTRTGAILRSPYMGVRQKFDFLVANLHWFDGVFVTTIALVLLYLGLGPLLGYDAVTQHQREVLLLAFLPLFLVVDGVLRLRMVLGRAGPTSVVQALQVQGMWFAIKLTNLTAAAKSLVGLRSPFVRTSKDPGQALGRWRSLLRALRVAKAESVLGAALAATAVYDASLVPVHAMAVDNVLLPAWLALYALAFLCAPLYAYLSYRTLQPRPEADPAPTPRPSATRQPRSVRVAPAAVRVAPVRPAGARRSPVDRTADGPPRIANAARRA